ncbi:cyclic dof factor 3-like [Pyrus ussuriensis x Pyrus communis]|uniref:Cyclic dof factor 3-like n=1 Tax=Pyrus ussuriensis x Pyrus communis TaxID=2448454 RepID=A0A5N5FEP5_9ROSA|nr:cyclic dof factor 3-like [Pyrus ussuriensis x Pyrus communis]
MQLTNAVIGPSMVEAIVTFVPNLRFLSLRRSQIPRELMVMLLKEMKNLVLLDVRECVGFDQQDEEILRLGFSDSAAAHSLFHPSSMPRHFPTASHFRHMTISEALEAARIDAPNGVHHSALKSNGRVLSFGVDAPICDSMASSLNPADKKVPNGTQNGLHKSEEQNVNGFSS